jgi:hypothetical protein
MCARMHECPHNAQHQRRRVAPSAACWFGGLVVFQILKGYRSVERHIPRAQAHTVVHFMCLSKKAMIFSGCLPK